MTNTQHTPGPWAISEVDTNCIMKPMRSGYIASVYHSIPDEEWQANACLIAAAPELLMALHHARECLLRANATCDIGRIDSVIAKAEGK